MKNSLYKLLAAATDKPLFFAYQNGNKLPPEPYITIHVLSVNQQAREHKQLLDAGGSRSVSAHKVAKVQLDCYGADSYQVLEDMAMQFALDAVAQKAEQLNVSISEVTDIKSAPVSMSDASWKHRSVMTFTYNYTVGTNETLPIITQAETKGDYK